MTHGKIGRENSPEAAKRPQTAPGAGFLRLLFHLQNSLNLEYFKEKIHLKVEKVEEVREKRLFE